jgi:hypothetical protein
VSFFAVGKFMVAKEETYSFGFTDIYPSATSMV